MSDADYMYLHCGLCIELEELRKPGGRWEGWNGGLRQMLL